MARCSLKKCKEQKKKRREGSRSRLVVRRPFPAGIHSPGSGGGSGRPLSCRLLFRFVHKGVRKSTDEYRHVCISTEYSALLLLFFFPAAFRAQSAPSSAASAHFAAAVNSSLVWPTAKGEASANTGSVITPQTSGFCFLATPHARKSVILKMFGDVSGCRCLGWRRKLRVASIFFFFYCFIVIRSISRFMFTLWKYFFKILRESHLWLCRPASPHSERLAPSSGLKS